jgi:hypothetical protein
MIIFILFATLLIFLLPKLFGQFSANQIINVLLTRCCVIIGFYLMVMNAGIIHSVATQAGYMTGEITQFLYLLGLAGYLLMAATFLKTTFDLILNYKNQVKERRGL